MRDDAEIECHAIARCLEDHYGLRAVEITRLPFGFDPAATVYEVVDAGGGAWFLKDRRGPVNELALAVPSALTEAGVPNILAPVRTRSERLLCELDGHTVTLFPFVRGKCAMVAGLSDDQWRTFGMTLRAVHDSGLERRFRSSLRVEDFTLPSAAPVRRLLDTIGGMVADSPSARDLAAVLRDHAERIRSMLDWTEALGHTLRDRPFARVLCHADIHAANVLAGEDGRIWLVDWDGPMIAPRERDLLFVIGSTIARPVAPCEERLFFEGYGHVEVDVEALIYYRYERIIEDIGAFGESVFHDPAATEEDMKDAVRLTRAFLAQGGDIDRADVVSWP